MASRKEEKERKEALLVERLNRVPDPDRRTHLECLLDGYSRGENRRKEIVDNIVAEFRPFLRKKPGSPNYDGPLTKRLIEAMTAAEEYGKEHGKQMVVAISSVLPDSAINATRTRSLFSPNEVQRCLFCRQEYRPAVEVHNCL